jgi:hypothetical protein
MSIRVVHILWYVICISTLPLGTRATRHYCSHHAIENGLKSKAITTEAVLDSLLASRRFQAENDTKEALGVITSVADPGVTIDTWQKGLHSFFSKHLLNMNQCCDLVRVGARVLSDQTTFRVCAFEERLLMVLHPYVVGRNEEPSTGEPLSVSDCLFLHLESSLSVRSEILRIFKLTLSEYNLDIHSLSQEGIRVALEVLLKRLSRGEGFPSSLQRYDEKDLDVSEYFWDPTFCFNTESGRVLK